MEVMLKYITTGLEGQIHLMEDLFDIECFGPCFHDGAQRGHFPGEAAFLQREMRTGFFLFCNCLIVF